MYAPTISVGDLNDLRALTPPSAGSEMEVSVLHHTREGDRGGGVFVWNPDFIGVASDAAWIATGLPYGVNTPEPPPDIFDNNGTFIKPLSISDGDPGRWIRKESGARNNRMSAWWFGAFPYTNVVIGSLPNSIDSIQAFQAAYDALPIRPFGGGPTPSGRMIRIGTLYIPEGTYIVSETLYFTCRSTIEGAGKVATRIVAKQGSFPAGTEKWMIECEKPDLENWNNGFNTRVSNLYVNGSSSLGVGNHGSSGIYVNGAQGSGAFDVDAWYMGRRGIVTPGIFGQCNVTGILVGPGISITNNMSSGKFGVITCQHVNQSALHVFDDGLPVPAFLLENAYFTEIELLNFELSPRELLIRNSSDIKISRITANTWARGENIINGFPSIGVHLKGNLSNLTIPDIEYNKHGGDCFAREIFDESAAAIDRRRVKELQFKNRRFFEQPFAITSGAPTNQTWSSYVLSQITFRNVAYKIHPMGEGFDITLEFINTGESSSLSLVQSGSNGEHFLVTLERSGNASVTTRRMLTDLFLNHSSMYKERLAGNNWLKVDLNQGVSDAAIVDPPNGTIQIIPASVNPGPLPNPSPSGSTWDFRGIRAGDIIYWPNAAATGGKAVCTQTEPIQFEIITGSFSSKPNSIATRDADEIIRSKGFEASAFMLVPGPFANDAAAATGGVPVGSLYRHSSGSVNWRQT